MEVSIERKDTANESGRVGLMPRIQPVQYTERFERVSYVRLRVAHQYMVS